jgi:hypothetical protein
MKVDQGCAWCGETPLTREHLLPQWVVELLLSTFPSDEGFDQAYVFATASGEGKPRAYTVDKPTLVVKAVCESCNSGWMAALEGEVAPILGPLVCGEYTEISQADQIILARWAAKVAVLMEHYEDGVVVLDDSDLGTIQNDGIAPMSFLIRLAYREDAAETPFNFLLSSHFAQPTSSPDTTASDEAEPNSFSVTLGIGHVTFSVIGGPAMRNPERWQDGSTLPMTIWPPTSGGLSWPPQHPVIANHEDLREFHLGFWERIQNPEFPTADAARYLPQDPGS